MIVSASQLSDFQFFRLSELTKLILSLGCLHKTLPRKRIWKEVTVAYFEVLYRNLAGHSGRAVCSRSPPEIVVSNPTGGMDVCQLWVSCVVR